MFSRNLFSYLNPRAIKYSTEATFQITNPFRLHKLSEGPPLTSTLKKEEALKIYSQMQHIRKMEAATNVLYKSKTIRGFCHLYSGQEAIGVGVFSMLGPTDTALTSYRAHAWAYLFSNDMDSIFCELTGKATGCAKGKGGSMHMYADRFYGGNAIVGAQIPLGVGLALASKYKGDNGVCIALYGDGASSNGQVFEVYNIAKLLSLPCIFLCENNLYGMGTSVQRSSANVELYKKGDAVPGIWVDGMDVFAMREAARFSLELCRSGKGPILIEAESYRYFGHSLSDPGTSYRTREEIQGVRSTRDPITLFKNKILEAKLVIEDELKNEEKIAKAVVDKCVKKAKADKDPDLQALTVDIYANDVVKEVRGISPWATLQHKSTGIAQKSK